MKKYNTKFKWDHTHTHNTYIYNKISSERIKIRGTDDIHRSVCVYVCVYIYIYIPKNCCGGGLLFSNVVVSVKFEFSMKNYNKKVPSDLFFLTSRTTEIDRGRPAPSEAKLVVNHY